MRISVVMCTYNGAKYVAEQVRSIIDQTVPVDEIVICDDGSTDDTVDIALSVLENHGFLNYMILDDGSHHGVSANFLRGLKASSGDYVFCSDQDDVWRDNKVEVFLNAVNESHRDLYFSDGYVVDARLAKRPYSLWDTLHFSLDMLERCSMLEVLLSRCVVTGAAMLVSRDLIDKVDEVPDSWLHDGWFAMVAASEGSIEPIDKETFLYRQHGKNVVGAHADSFVGRIRSWVDSISSQPEVRKQRLDRYTRAYVQLSLQDDAVEGCLNFWTKLNSLGDNGCLRGIFTVVEMLADGSYSKYYTGALGAMRDFIWLLRYKATRRIG